MLLLRAFYDKFANMKDKQSVKMREAIARCVWKTDEFDEPDMERLKIDSEVASDNDKGEFHEILREGYVGAGWKSAFARNFAYFQKKIEQLVSEWPTYTVYMATRVINNVILLPIEAESQDTALRIFSTLNDRGLPLSDADIFKSQFYKHYSDEGRKDEFIRRWKVLEAGANAIFRPMRGTPMDELFTRYMYYRRRGSASATPPPRFCATSSARTATPCSRRRARSATWRRSWASGTRSTRRRASATGSCAGSSC